MFFTLVAFVEDASIGVSLVTLDISLCYCVCLCVFISVHWSDVGGIVYSG